jgi:hypothetical protein
MRIKTYYKFALTTPLWLPLAGYPLIGRTSLDWLFGIWFYSVILGGIPYFVFLVSIIFWARSKGGAHLRRATIFFHPLFALLLPLCLIIYAFTVNDGPVHWKDIWELFRIFSFYALVIGYIYVGFAAVSSALLMHCGIVRDDTISQAPFISLHL